jgi:hypothetical protein
MNPELAAFLSANGTVIVLVLGAVAAVGIVQWRKLRVAEQELEYRQALLDKGVPPAEVERAAGPRTSTRRGIVEQFASLSGGAKTGIIAGFVIVCVVTVSCIAGAIQGFAFWSHVRHQQAAGAQRATVQPPGASADAIQGHAFYLDLQPVANHQLDAVTGDRGHSLAGLPQRRRELGGVPFQIGPRYLRLRGTNHPALPLDAKGIRVGFKFDRLHVLHGSDFGVFGDAPHRFHVPDGTEIGRYRLHFADGSGRTIPVVYGQDVRDAWHRDNSRAVSRGRVVWTGTSQAATREGASPRLYLTSWTNPRPDAEVTHIDFASAGTAASPFCVAITAERAWKSHRGEQ